MANRRFIDTDGKLATIAFGAEITGDGSTALTQGDKYLVTAIDSGTSGLPTGAKVKYIIEAGASTVPATGDKVKPLVVTDACDVQGASVEFTKDELETTTICDTTKTYRAGRADASGSIQAVTTGWNRDSQSIASGACNVKFLHFVVKFLFSLVTPLVKFLKKKKFFLNSHNFHNSTMALIAAWMQMKC